MLVHHFLICKLPNIPICVRIKSIRTGPCLRFVPTNFHEKRLMYFFFYFIEDLSRRLGVELCVML